VFGDFGGVLGLSGFGVFLGVLGFRVFGGFGCLEVLWCLGVLGCLRVTFEVMAPVADASRPPSVGPYTTF